MVCVNQDMSLVNTEKKIKKDVGLAFFVQLKWFSHVFPPSFPAGDAVAPETPPPSAAGAPASRHSHGPAAAAHGAGTAGYGGEDRSCKATPILEAVGILG